MDNASRSERTRNAILDAALTVIAREGAGRLTLDAIVRESGISKGGLMHQFRSKELVLQALLERHSAHFAAFKRDFLAANEAALPQPELAAQIAVLREGTTTGSSLFYALIGAAAEEPSRLESMRDGITQALQKVDAETDNRDCAHLRLVAAWGLNLTTLLGLSPFSPEERERLFDRLQDSRFWEGAGAKPAKPAKAEKAKPGTEKKPKPRTAR